MTYLKSAAWAAIAFLVTSAASADVTFGLNRNGSEGVQSLAFWKNMQDEAPNDPST